MEEIRPKGEPLTIHKSTSVGASEIPQEVLESLKGVVLTTHKPLHPPARILRNISEGLEPSSRFPGPYVRKPIEFNSKPDVLFDPKQVVLDHSQAPDCCKQGCQYAKDQGAPEYSCAGMYCNKYQEVKDVQLT